MVPADLEASQIRISETKDGFSLTSEGTPYPEGTQISVRVAYETSKGNPIKAYKVHDFDLASPAIATRAKGCEITAKKENALVITVRDSKFSVQISGFDVNRDLVVRAKIEKAGSNSDESESLV
jgi:hypothetical protein